MISLIASRTPFPTSRAVTTSTAFRGFLVGISNLSTSTTIAAAAVTTPTAKAPAITTNSPNPNDGGSVEEEAPRATKVKFNPESLPVTFSDISRAHVRIRSGIKKTTCDQSFFLSELVEANVYLKTEFTQFTGSFKERGARNAILSLLQERGPEFQKRGGVIAASAGNHALALAYHGKELGVPVTVVMPTVAPLAKVDKCRKFQANIIIHGAHIGEAKQYAEEIVKERGLVYINGYDDPPIVAGAGTIGVEIIEAVPCVDFVVVPIGGAGLIAGISCAIKTLKPTCKVRRYNTLHCDVLFFCTPCFSTHEYPP
jgi:threonine dehydratase